MSLFLLDGTAFTSAVTPYQHLPLMASEDEPRVLVQVEIMGFQTRAMIDTGGIYMICSPQIGMFMEFEGLPSLGEAKIGIARLGGIVEGSLFRVPLKILPEAGNVPVLEVTAFVPDNPNLYRMEDDMPYVVLGYYCCLERLRFAVDPLSNRFYYGVPEEELLP